MRNDRFLRRGRQLCPGGSIAGQLGLPRPVKLERHRAGAPVISGPRAHRRRAGRAAGRGDRPGARRDRRAERRRGGRAGQGAALRRDRDRRLDAAGRAAALLSCQRQAGTGQRPDRRARLAAGACIRPARPCSRGAGRLGAAGHRAAGAGGLHPLARQGGRRRHRRAAGLRRAGRRGPARLDPALPALAALGLRLRAGDRDRQRRSPNSRDRLGAPARRQAGAGHRRLAGDRRGDRGDAARDGAQRRRCSTCRRLPGDLAKVAARLGGETIELDITDRGGAAADRRAASRAGSTWSSTTPA